MTGRMVGMLTAILIAGGCANLKIEKIPDPKRYDLNTSCQGDKDNPCRNELQRRADAIDGVRYYLPRPYVVVKQEFPVGGGTWFATGTLSADGTSIAVTSVPDAISHLFPGGQATTAGAKRGGDSGDEAVDLQSGEAADDAEGSGDGDKYQSKLSGVKASISGDPTTNPKTDISPLYDILLLPDFDEQYAIDAQSGLFKADADIGLENGWMVEKVDVEIDNSKLGDLFVSSAEKLVDAGLAAAFPAQAAVDAAAKKPDASPVDLQSGGGSQVTIRVDQVIYAVPGVYPILKPEERAECANQRCGPKVEFDTREVSVMSLGLGATDAGSNGDSGGGSPFDQ